MPCSPAAGHGRVRARGPHLARGLRVAAMRADEFDLHHGRRRGGARPPLAPRLASHERLSRSATGWPSTPAATRGWPGSWSGLATPCGPTTTADMAARRARDDDLGHFADEARLHAGRRRPAGRPRRARPRRPGRCGPHRGTVRPQHGLVHLPGRPGAARAVAVGRGRPHRVRRPGRAQLRGLPPGGQGRTPAARPPWAQHASWTTLAFAPVQPRRSGPPGPIRTGSRAMTPRSTSSSRTHAPGSA